MATRRGIAASAADVALRLGAQMLGTVVIARLLPAEDFGLAMLALAVVALFGAFVSLPFEEALAQRARVTAGHLGSALAVSLALSVAAFLILLLLGPAIAGAAAAPGLEIWLPVAALFLLGQGPGAIARALSRRHRRFTELAFCQSASVLLATLLAIALAFGGFGVMALILQRMLPVVLYPVLAAGATMLRGGAALVRPVFVAARFREIFRFSWIYLADTIVHYATPAGLTFLVNAYFGTAVLGQVNIAYRLSEPLRLGVQSVGHNLVFAFLARIRARPEALVAAALDVVSRMATLAVPAFLGLALVTPLLLPLLVGPGWTEAIPLARAFCLAAAINVPFLYVWTGYSALGRPEFGLCASTLGFLVMIAGLALAGTGIAGTAGIGWVMIASELAIALLGLLFGAWFLGTRVLAPVGRIARIWAAAAAMVGLLDWAGLTDPARAPLPGLLMAVAAGMLVYPPLLYLLCRPEFDFLRLTVARRGGEIA